MGVFERSPNDPKLKQLNPFLKLALELGPLAVFFFGNAFGDRLAAAFPPLAALGGRLFIGTALFIVATVIALAVSYILIRRLPIMPFVSGIVVLVFGGMTLWLQNEAFIKIKPTIIYVLFGATLLGGLLFNRPLPGYAQYRGPVKGFYMCGSSTHPGGGVMGAPGANAAREILLDLKRKRREA